MIETNLARQMARKAGMFCRVCGDRLAFYKGDETQAATWIEAGSTLLETREGVCLVSRHAVELILR